MEKSEKITWITSIVLVGFVVGILFHYILDSYLHVGVYLKSFLPNDITDSLRLYFLDFESLIPFVHNLSPYNEGSNSLFIYFPVGYLLLYPFSLIKNFYLSYSIYILVFLIPFIYLNYRFLNCNNLSKIDNFKNIFVLSFISYPVLWLFVSGNLDMMLYLLIFGFVYFFYREKYLWAALLLAISNSAKPFFLIFLFLFLFKGKRKMFFVSLILTAIFVFVGFLFFKGSIFSQIQTLMGSLGLYKREFIDYKGYIRIGTSDMFSTLRFLLCSLNETVSGSNLIKVTSSFINKDIIPCPVLVGLYSILAPLVTSVILFFTYKEKIFWKQIALVILCVLTFSPVVFDYKLIFLYIPMILFVNSKEKSNFDFVYTILFGVMLIPKKILMVGFTEVILFSKIVNPFIMLGFICLIIREQILNKKKEE